MNCLVSYYPRARLRRRKTTAFVSTSRRCLLDKESWVLFIFYCIHVAQGPNHARINMYECSCTCRTPPKKEIQTHDWPFKGALPTAHSVSASMSDHHATWSSPRTSTQFIRLQVYNNLLNRPKAANCVGGHTKGHTISRNLSEQTPVPFKK